MQFDGLLVQERRLRAQAHADAGKMRPTVQAFVPTQMISAKPERAQELGWASESSEIATQRQRESMEVRSHVDHTKCSTTSEA